MNLNGFEKFAENLSDTEKMPVLFIGHGSPTNAIENNEFTNGWNNIISKIQTPQAILCISAHWQTKGTQITAMQNPRTIYDFSGFQDALYEIKYNAPGNPVLAGEIQKNIAYAPVTLDNTWGLDHGCWVPLLKMYPKANIPVLQLSLDYTKGPQYHYDLAKQLAKFREKGILIMGSGNMVHNLGMIQLKHGFNSINEEFGFDWALEMNDIFKQKISSGNHAALIKYESLSKSAKLAIPTNEHYLPLLYILALQNADEQAIFFNDKAVAGSLTMTSVIIKS